MFGCRDLMRCNKGISKSKNKPLSALPYSPLLDSPAALWMTHRDIRTDASIMVLRLVGSVSGDMYMKAALQGQEAFIDHNGDTIDASGETWIAPEVHDQTGNGHHLISPAGKESILLFNQTNGYPSLQGALGEHYLSGDALFAGLSQAAIFARINIDTTAGNGALFLDFLNASTAFAYYPEYAGVSYYQINTAYGYINYYGAGWHNELFAYNGNLVGNNKIKAYWDNIEKALSYSGSIPAALSAHTISYVGGYVGPNPYMGKWAAIVPFAIEPTEAQRTNLQAYLAAH